jgi:RNAse (barnase) inhibitor barstar
VSALRTRADTPFVFYEPDQIFGDGMIANVRAGIASVEELYDVLGDALHLPSYFGRNWDALGEVLGDLSWLAPRQVVIVHADLPELPVEELRVYLDVLRTAVDAWTRGSGAHELVVAFPEPVQLAIRRLLR